jgi:hypothetical protein
MSEVHPVPDAGRSAPRAQRRVTRRQELLLSVLTPVLKLLLRLIWKLFRFEVRGDAALRERFADGQPVVFAFWHEGLLVVCWYMARLLEAGIKVTFLISPSVDGEVGVRILAAFGSKAVRGSSRRSGAAALRGLVATIRRDRQSPCITLDGSKGPRRYCKPGAIMVARMAEAPIVPVGFAARRSWRLPSWDRHLVPRPASRVVISIGQAYRVAREPGDDAMEKQRRELEERVNQQMSEAEAAVGAQAERVAPFRGADEEDE